MVRVSLQSLFGEDLGINQTQGSMTSFLARCLGAMDSNLILVHGVDTFYYLLPNIKHLHSLESVIQPNQEWKLNQAVESLSPLTTSRRRAVLHMS